MVFDGQNTDLPKEYDPDWWREIFDDLYLITDARTVNNEEATQREVDLLLEVVQPCKEDVILDLCGGQGRHAFSLYKRGFSRVIVMDYSQVLLSFGQRNARGGNISLPFCRGDARKLPVTENSVDVVLVMGNSFGYFPDETENRTILEEVRRVLKPGGKVFLDLCDKEYVLQNIRPTWHEADEDILVCRDRHCCKEGVISKEIILSKQKGLLRENVYYMRLYDSEEIMQNLRTQGFHKVKCSNGSKGSANMSLGMMASRMFVSARSA